MSVMKYYNATTLAKYLETSLVTVMKHIKAGEIRAVENGRYYIITEREAERVKAIIGNGSRSYHLFPQSGVRKRRIKT